MRHAPPSVALLPEAQDGRAWAGLSLQWGRAMIYKETLPNNQEVRVTFELPSSIWAERVNLVGDFNQWDTAKDELHQSRTDGKWRITLTLPTHKEYEFRYLVNGRDWHNDWHADKYRSNKYGTDNSVVCT
jgi:1,4-alpha-glucan branching enzyme